MKAIRRKKLYYIIPITWLFTAWLVTLALADETVTVKYVIDGDTIILVDGRHVRYQGIDAPEIAHDGQSGDPFGEEARLYNEKLLQGRKVRLKLDEQHTDHYGRILAQVFLPDGTWVNKAMAAEGLAYVCRYEQELTTSISHFDALLRAQQSAILAKRGMWSAPPARPAPYYVGNTRTMRLHRPDCPSTKDTSKTNQIVFKTRNEAFMQGFCPCRRCKP
jgi:endonuclease YncB( thermonuclease family)